MGCLGAWTWLVLSRTRFAHQNHCTQDSETEGIFCILFVIFLVTVLGSNLKIFSVGTMCPMGCSAFVLLPLSCFSMPIWFSWWPPSECKTVQLNLLRTELLHFLSWNLPMPCLSQPFNPARFWSCPPRGMPPFFPLSFQALFPPWNWALVLSWLSGKMWGDGWGGLFGCVQVLAPGED